MNMRDSLNVIGLSTGVALRKVKVCYRYLARQLHPDKHSSLITGIISEEAVKLFKLINNAQHFIRATISKYDSSRYANNGFKTGTYYVNGSDDVICYLFMSDL